MKTSSFLIVNGKKFRCECGCNLFHQAKEEGLWFCNCCDNCYADETYVEKTTIFEFITKDVRNLAFILSELVKMENPPFSNYEEAVKWLLEMNE